MNSKVMVHSSSSPAYGLWLALLLLLGGLSLVPYFEWPLLLAHGAISDATWAVLTHIRLPSALLALLVGANLAMAGRLLQTSLNNPFASPSTLGVGSGALLGAVLTSVLVPDSHYLVLWLGAFVGGLLSGLLVYALARVLGGTDLHLVLIGMALSLGLGAVSAGLLIFYENRLDGLFLWGGGQITQADWSLLTQLLPWLVLLPLLPLLLLKGLESFRLGESQARSLGIATERWRWLALFIAILQASLVISAVGIIGFVGLLVPHAVNLMRLRPGYPQWLMTLALGALLVLLAENTSHWLNDGQYTLPAGVITVLLGSPYLVWLLLTPRLRRHTAMEPRRFALPQLGQLSAATLLWGTLLFVAVSAWGLAWGADASVLRRLVMAALVGWGLGLAGASLQTLFRNPMASPDVSGLSACGVLAIALVLLFWPALPRQWMILLALAGSLAALAVLTLGLRLRMSAAHLALLGITLSAFASTATTLCLTFGSETAASTMVWLAGTTYGADFYALSTLALIVLPASGLMLLLARPLDALQLGELMPRLLGLPVRPLQAGVLLLTGLITAAAVAVAGAIGFIGLLSPHIARVLGARQHRLLLPVSGLLGAGLMLWADALGRLLLFPFEIPVGLVVSVLGSLYFLLLLLLGYRGKKSA